jgi:hypothetical protein
MHSATFGNAETLRTQSSYPSISFALSASPRFKPSLAEIAERGYVLTPGRTACAEELEDAGVQSISKPRRGLTRELATQFHESETCKTCNA